MAGGPNAQHVACLVCFGDGVLTKATRVHEGIEDDQFRCEKGHTFGVDYSHGPPEEPEWPPPQDLVAALKKA